MNFKKMMWSFGVLILGSSVVQAETHAFPVPFTPSKGHTSITFTDLPGSGSIKVFDATGEIVTELPIAPGEILKGWNVTNSSGKRLASGVYFYLVTGESKRGKLVVIR